MRCFFIVSSTWVLLSSGCSVQPLDGSVALSDSRCELGLVCAVQQGAGSFPRLLDGYLNGDSSVANLGKERHIGDVQVSFGSAAKEFPVAVSLAHHKDGAGADSTMTVLEIEVPLGDLSGKDSPVTLSWFLQRSSRSGGRWSEPMLKIKQSGLELDSADGFADLASLLRKSEHPLGQRYQELSELRKQEKAPEAFANQGGEHGWGRHVPTRADYTAEGRQPRVILSDAISDLADVPNMMSAIRSAIQPAQD